ncbi:MAG: hypothetical protein FWE05_11910 [Defluviitaleaceae bacterium]|nr:hypothetical protein [Defluviitaleaceae bacterium]
MKTIKVKFYQEKSGFCTITFVTVGADKKRYYNRFDTGEWYTSTPEYFETDTRVRDDVVFEIVGVSGKGDTIFTESNGNPKKTFISYDEKAAIIAKEYLQSNEYLKSYEAWKSWMMAEKEAFGNKDYKENWMYAMADVVKDEIVLTYEHLGCEFAITRSERKHRISGKSYTHVNVVQIMPGYEFKPCIAIVGYDFIEEK